MINIAKPLDVPSRLNELKLLNLDGVLLDKLCQFFVTYYPNELPLPYIFPTEKGVQFEWRLQDASPEIEIDLASLHGEWLLNDEEKMIDLSLAHGWKSLANHISKLCKNNKMFPNDKRILEMEKLATKYHNGQFRKFFEPPVPYIVHPLQVATNVDALNISDLELKIKMICAAIGHDLLEDTSVTEQEIIDVAGEDVLKLIKELTNPSKGMKAPRYIRKKVDRDHLKTVSNEAKIIKLIDRTVNLGDFEGCDDVNFVRLYIKESRELLEVIQDAHENLAIILNKTLANLENKLDSNNDI